MSADPKNSAAPVCENDDVSDGGEFTNDAIFLPKGANVYEVESEEGDFESEDGDFDMDGLDEEQYGAEEDGYEEEEEYEVPEDLADTSTWTIPFEDSAVSVALNRFNPNIVVSAGCDDQLLVHRLCPNGVTELLHSLSCHSDTVTAIRFNFDGTLCATASMDGTVAVWNTSDWSLKRRFEGAADSLECLEWHPRGNVFACGCSDGTAWLWQVSSATPLHVLVGHADAITSIAFCNGGRLVATGSLDGSVIVFDPKTGNAQLTLADRQTRHWHSSCISAIAAHPLQPLLASADDQGVVCITNIESGLVLQRVGSHNNNVEGLCFGAPKIQNGLLAIADLSGELSVHDCMQFNQRVFVKNTHCFGGVDGAPIIDEDIDKDAEGFTKAVFVNEEGYPRVVTSGMDGSCRVFDARNGELLGLFTGHKRRLNDLSAVAFDEKNEADNINSKLIRIASASEDNTVKIFEL